MGIGHRRGVIGSLCVTALFVVRAASAAAPAAGFTSLAQQLPNPDQPYDMTSGTVVFRSPPIFALYDLQFQPSNTAQLDIPSLGTNGSWNFDSVFDIKYQAVVSFGTEPAHQVSGIGKAHMSGSAAAGQYDEPQVFDAEISSLNLYGLSLIPEIYFRESPTLASKGIIVREDTCPPCAGPTTRWRIGSFFDVNGEFSNGGSTWTPGDKPFRIEQAPGPVPTGDYNGDGRVDLADFVLLRKGLGTTYSQVDLISWRATFGAASGAGGTATYTGVPEPAALRLLGCLLAFISCYRRAGRVLRYA